MMRCDSGEASMEGEGKFFVSVRVRPLNEKEAARNEDVDWECINDTQIIYKNSTFGPSRSSMYPSSYSFDRVFGPNCSTGQVYQEGAKAISLSAVAGINASVFAYGQTSSGKTYTMTGITEYAMADIFDHIHKHTEREFLLKFSAMEIYNESVRDLLSLDATPLRLLDDPERGTVVDKLTEEVVRDWNHLATLLSVCKAQRQIGETLLNESSSRSHQIIKLTVESYVREVSGKDTSSALFATVNFIDLGGSEHASQALSAGSRLKEGSHINHSLLALGTVIRELSEGRNGHVLYRDSKLTRILQSSLGVNTRTAIICTMIPARSYVEQSRNTLLFATYAKQVTTSAKVNLELSDKALAKRVQIKPARLENELSNAESSFGTDSVSLVKEKDLLIHKLERLVRELTLQRDLALSHINDVQLEEPGNLPYPKLHVRRLSWASQTSQGSPAADLHSINSDSVTLETPRPSIRHSCCSCCDKDSSFSDFDNNVSPRIPAEPAPYEISYDDSPRLFIQSVVGQAELMNDTETTSISLEENREIMPLKVDEETQIQGHGLPSSWDQNENVNKDESSGSLPSLQPEVEKAEVQLDQNKCSLNDGVNETISDKSICFLRETQAPDAKVSTEDVIRNRDSHIAEIKEATHVQCTKENAVLLGENVSIKSMKDAVVQCDLDTEEWESDFDRLRREVIGLWDACNVSLLYRSSFFLLFAGDPKDSIYMEVERRRLSFVKNAFAWGNETVLDGRIISPSLSKKHMQQERQMLSKMLKSRISKDEREILYIKWGIHLDTKKRRSQLIYHVWSKPKDMDHVQESARVVSMLIKFDKTHTRNQMFGINLMPALKGVGSRNRLHSASVRF